MTVGPWKPISVHAYTTRIADLRSVIDVKDDLSVHAEISLELEGTSNGLTAKYAILDSDGKLVHSDSIDVEGSKGAASFEGKAGVYDLWYPVGYGKQALYTIQITVIDEVSVLGITSRNLVQASLTALNHKLSRKETLLMNRRNVSGSDASGSSKTSLRTSLVIHSSLKSTIFAFSAEVSTSMSLTFTLYRK